MKIYSGSSWLLTLICLAVFAIQWLLHVWAFLRGRYKVLVIAQAVSIAYLLFGMLTYISQGPLLYFMAEYLNIPRGVLITSWGLTILFLIASRAWVVIWKRLIRADSRVLSAGASKDQSSAGHWWCRIYRIRAAADAACKGLSSSSA
jgi:FlaA1/EpsC-like NDP-sugar epimerase